MLYLFNTWNLKYYIKDIELLFYSKYNMYYDLFFISKSSLIIIFSVCNGDNDINKNVGDVGEPIWIIMLQNNMIH